MFNFRFGRRLAAGSDDYDFPPFRPPSEADSLLLRVTRGCPWNRCAFCPMYKNMKFEQRSAQAVMADIDTAKALMAPDWTAPDVENVFIGDSDSLVGRTDDICTVLDHLHRAFPRLGRVTTYARALTIKAKRLGSLCRIRNAGLTRLHVGLETGSAALLRRIQKGAGPRTMIEGCHKAKAAQFEVSVYVLLGIGGQAAWREHALETARVVNEIDPHFIRVRTLTPQPGTALHDWWVEGTFRLPTPSALLDEQRLFIERLEVRSLYLSDHVSNYAPVHGQLPDDKHEMLATIDSTLDRLSRDEAFRAELEKMAHQRML